MRTSQLVLHALPEELLSFVDGWISTGMFRAAALWTVPKFSVVQVSSKDELRTEVSRRGPPSQVCIARAGFVVAATTLFDFVSKNTIECIVDFGELTPEGLKESAITASTDDPERRRFWMRALKEVKTATTAGLWAVNPISGARSFSKNNRYTSGAEKLVSGGRKLLPTAGWNHYEIGVRDS